MSELVDREEIERIVGARRDVSAHIGRADSKASKFYILHSALCASLGRDLRKCDYSRALDKGINDTWSYWEHMQDRPVTLDIDSHGFLIPRPGGS